MPGNRTSTRLPLEIPPHIQAEDRSDLPVGRRELLQRLKNLQSQLAVEGVTALYLYGSYARGDADYLSDIDVFIDYDPSVKEHFSILDLVKIQHIIEDEFDVHADVTTRTSLGRIAQEAQADAMRVF